MATERASRYGYVSGRKAEGATYTPKLLAEFVAEQIVQSAEDLLEQRPVRVLDPAVGEGVLLISLLGSLTRRAVREIEVFGFETDREALALARSRLSEFFPHIGFQFEHGSFLEFVPEPCKGELDPTTEGNGRYDLIIANPPYVRTQIMGSARAQRLSRRFGLNGRVDLYYPFITGMALFLKPGGIAGVITSNRFMTTRSGAAVRRAIRERFVIRHVWDLGDTRLFDAAVLPAVMLLEGKGKQPAGEPRFTSIYQTNEADTPMHAPDPIAALPEAGIVKVGRRGCFRVRKGRLDDSGKMDGIWRVGTVEDDAWLSIVRDHTWRTFGAVGKIRVGVKTCADSVFIRPDWQDMPERDRPELLRPLTTHHRARRFKPLHLEHPWQILYPHEVLSGRRKPVDLSKYPSAESYLKRHRPDLESRNYVIEAGRKWYEIWVPQDPGAWDQPKLVFRDIAKEPTFWIDEERSIINGDCYWLVSKDPAQVEILWLAAAVANSTFMEAFYDRRFHNKLYAGRRRFITQYVKDFPLPSPEKSVGREILRLSKEVYDLTPSAEAERLEKRINRLVWKAFGLPFREPASTSPSLT